MFNLGNLVATIKADISNFQSGMSTVASTAKKTTSSVASGFKQAGSTMTGAGVVMTALSAPIIALGVTGTKTAIDTETAWKNVEKVYDGTADEIKNTLMPAAKDLSIEFGKQKVQVIGVMDELASMGFKGPKLVDLTRESMEFATASGMELADATGAVVAIQAVYGVEGEELTKTLAMLNAVENATAAGTEDLTTVIRIAGDAALGTGVDIEELAAFTAVLAERDIEAGEAGNALKSIFMKVRRETKVGGETYEKLGIQIQDASGNMMDSDEILVKLAGKWEDLTEAEQDEFIQKQIGIMQGSKFRALMADLKDDESTYTQTLKDTNDERQNVITYEKEVAIFLDQSSTKMAQAKITIAELGETMGKLILEYLIPLLEIVKKVIGWFTDLPKPVQKIIMTLVLLFAAIGPILIILGQMATGIGAIISFIGMIGGAGGLIGAFTGLISMITGALSGAMAFLVSNPIGWVILGIMALIAIGVLLWKNWDKIKEFAGKTWDNIKKIFTRFINWWKDTWKAIFEWYINAWKNIFAKAKEIISTVFNAIKDFIKNYITWYINAWKTVFNWYIDTWKNIFNKAKEIVTNVFNAIKDFLSKIFEWIKTAVTNIGNDIAEGFRNGIDKAKAGIEEKFNAIVSFIKDIPRKVKDGLSHLWEAIKTPFEKAYNEAKRWVQKIKDELSRINPFHRDSPSLVDNVKSGVDAIKGYYEGLQDMEMFRPAGLALATVPSANHASNPTSIIVDMNGANISSPEIAEKYGEAVGDAIISRLGKTRRSYR